MRGRYSIIGLDPDLVWRTVSGQAEINRTAQRRRRQFHALQPGPLAALRALIAESRIELPDVLPPMAAGIFGYLGYDMVRLMEELPQPNPDPIGIPDAVLMRPDHRGRVRQRERRDHRGHAGASGKRRRRRSRLHARERTPRAIVDALDAPLAHAPPDFQAGRSRCGRPPTLRPPNTSAW